jgi:hypothetical protein
MKCEGIKKYRLAEKNITLILFCLEHCVALYELVLAFCNKRKV